MPPSSWLEGVIKGKYVYINIIFNCNEDQNFVNSDALMMAGAGQKVGN